MKNTINNPVNGNETPDDSKYGYNRRKEFVNYLNSEINNLHNEIQRPGWTKWAVVGAISTLGWILLHSIESGGYLLRNVAGAILLIFLIEYILYGISSLMMNHSGTKGRFILPGIINSGRPLLLSMLGQYIFIIFVALEFSHDVPTIITVTIYVLFSILATTSIGVFILLTVKYPIPTIPTWRKRQMRSWLILSIILVLIMWQYIDYFLTSNSIITISDLRLALLIAAIFYLIRLLLISKKGGFILSSLITTRRELALNEIGLDTAIRHTDIAISGLRSIDIFEEYINNLLNLYGDVSIELRKTVDELNLREHVIVEKGTSISEEELTTLHESLKATDTRLQGILVITGDKIPKALQPIQRRLLWINSITEISGIAEEINQKLEDARDEVKRQLNKVTERLKTVVELVNKLKPVA